jgi:hypothetical protein
MARTIIPLARSAVIRCTSSGERHTRSTAKVTSAKLSFVENVGIKLSAAPTDPARRIAATDEADRYSSSGSGFRL